MTLRQLETFSNVAKYESFVQAAQHMCLTQAALSNMLRELETNIGCRLFNRTTRTVRLTSEGEIFLPYAERILSNLSNAVDCATALSEGKLGMIRIATTEVLASTHLMSAIANYQTQHPNIQVVMREALSDKILTDLKEEKVDIAIGPERMIQEGIDSELVFTSRLVVLCSKKHHLAGHSSLTWQQIQHESVALAKGGTASTIQVDTNNAIQFGPANEIEHFTTLLALASIGNHIAVTTSYIESFLPVYNLKMIPLVEPVVERKVLLYTSKKFPLSYAAQEFTNYLKRTLRNK